MKYYIKVKFTNSYSLTYCVDNVLRGEGYVATKFFKSGKAAIAVVRKLRKIYDVSMVQLLMG